ncbi:hypothetical protein PRZ48_004934 [Zasmidium cellare]|uniref:Deacetylase sirtuin-type domain-containing protein n=1 Tax=Zasmidium cellare TaxID=395010 RepID=A0ABR0EQZ0_ZASCE|nr:hypothetical protein PRZ48_004934 [Zasmidium cellare]
MASASATISFPKTSMTSFHAHLKQYKRIVAFLGAGLSSSSGLIAYHGVGTGGSRHGHEFEALSSVKAFSETPRIVLEYHEERRRQARGVQPNAAHEAIAALARVKGSADFVAIDMNIDGLCSRAGLPKDQNLEIHGNLFDAKCSKPDCDYFKEGFFNDEYSTMARRGLPRCPRCASDLRPAVVWFGENLRKDAVDAAKAFLAKDEPIDLILVIGTTAQVWPAAGFVDSAIDKGASVAMVNVDRGSLVPEGGALGLTAKDWYFVGDPADMVPRLLAPLIGNRYIRL